MQGESEGSKNISNTLAHSLLGKRSHEHSIWSQSSSDHFNISLYAEDALNGNSLVLLEPFSRSLNIEMEKEKEKEGAEVWVFVRLYRDLLFLYDDIAIVTAVCRRLRI